MWRIQDYRNTPTHRKDGHAQRVREPAERALRIEISLLA
jgi:hypothetical protein